MKFFSKKKPPAPRPLCQYSETEGHKYFVSKQTELYLKYGCNLNGLVVCFIGEKMFPLCYHHHQRVIQWHEETEPNRKMECRSVWDINWEEQPKHSQS
jgi:hypothetical protein